MSRNDNNYGVFAPIAVLVAFGAMAWHLGNGRPLASVLWFLALIGGTFFFIIVLIGIGATNPDRGLPGYARTEAKIEYRADGYSDEEICRHIMKKWSGSYEMRKWRERTVERRTQFLNEGFSEREADRIVQAHLIRDANYDMYIGHGYNDSMGRWISVGKYQLLDKDNNVIPESEYGNYSTPRPPPGKDRLCRMPPRESKK